MCDPDTPQPLPAIEVADALVGTVLSPLMPNAMSGSSSSSPSISTFTSGVLPTDTVSAFLNKGGSLRKNHLSINEGWQYFHVYNKKRFKSHTCCVLCNKDVFYGLSHFTSNLEKHMSRLYKEDYKEIMCYRANNAQQASILVRHRQS